MTEADGPSALSRLIVALDVPSTADALAAAERLNGHVGMFKIGLQLFVAEGPSVVRELRERYPSIEIFLDLKLHDRPAARRGTSVE